MAAQLRFGDEVTGTYVALSLALPVLWLIALWLAGGYDVRFIGTGSDEFRKILNGGVGLTAAIALFSYAVNLQLSRAYVLIALPSATMLDLVGRYAIRKRLHRQRVAGRCLLSVVAVGHESAVADLVKELRREQYHGLTVVGACVTRPSECDEVAGVPVYGGLDDVTAAVRAFGADTVAVLACPEMDGIRLRTLAWDLEKTGTDLCVSPALLDVAGPRTTIRPTAGLTLLHVDHPQLSGMRLLSQGLVRSLRGGRGADPAGPAAGGRRRGDPALRRWAGAVHADQGRARTAGCSRSTSSAPWSSTPSSVRHSCSRTATRTASCSSSAKTRVSRRWERACGAGRSTSCRSWSTCSSATCRSSGPRPAVPDEVAQYAEHVRRRLVVKPGLTGLWQVNGRSDLSWDESVRLDLRYVENWSFALDLQILWKTVSALLYGSGAY